MSENFVARFDQLALPENILSALSSIGYEKPSPIQAECIPLVLDGIDLIGQAQTGTGKTAAFALPALTKIDINLRKPQVCIICPTRELALQVAEACTEYAKNMPGFRVLPIYGGQPYPPQLRQLDRGVHLIVGTPGRIMDHMRRGSLKWDHLKLLVLDEADEMLRMGFMEDVEWILEHTPEKRQIALFSATMPPAIKKVAKTFLQDPQHIQVKSKTKTASTIEQLFLTVSNNHKLEALTRVLESESSDATIVFTRTKSNCDELAKKLSARGFSAEAIHGDMAQNQREKIVQRLKSSKVDIVIATDVAARGLDVERISHVINFDIPQDPESYVHRIGRTGRAGRSGRAISFVTPREKRLLRIIEQTNTTKIQRMSLPSLEVINDERTRRFFDQIQQQIIAGEHESYLNLLEDLQNKNNQTGLEIAAAVVSLLYKDRPLLLQSLPELPDMEKGGRKERQSRHENISAKAEPLKGHPDVLLQRYVLRVGKQNRVTPKNIVGAIANEAGLDSDFIGNIHLYEDISTVDLPEGMPQDVLQMMKNVRVCGKKIEMELASDYLKGNKPTYKPSGKKRRSNNEQRDSGNRRPANREAKRRRPEAKKRKPK
ncbi:MAG: DEAD/DEAH box helicase [Pseudomonadota bacterium]